MSLGHSLKHTKGQYQRCNKVDSIIDVLGMNYKNLPIIQVR